jgi:hypothetical protein
MSRLLVAALTFFTVLNAPADAQMTTTPGPGGTRIAPGAPVTGYVPGGIGPGSGEVAPGPAAREVPMYRVGPGGVALPPRRDPARPDPYPDSDNAAARLDPSCGPDGCVPRTRYYSLQLTINSRDAGPSKTPSPETPIDTIDDLFAALRACWEPPAREQAREGVQMSVRFSFKRGGKLVAPPFVTYTTPGTEAAAKQVYRRAITAALERCTPLQFSKSFSGAIAGRPISVRYVDDRTISATRRSE